ncbi:2-keto-4-pentenoate hydratase [Nocardioides zeae]|uniref:2-keto-4-pentenoate hydratase n=1 Tax=Nocardioides zeae TaxID=1457234 RepID=A0A6P0HFR4_9ACTN|nr:fumarylacetoacetate hydrolase family protein [Nocardioides zeae]NEN77137.1 2-keto-4-pentenoate hydratase [Nocardioides zeae]
MTETTTGVDAAALSAAAGRLRDADRAGVPGPPVRDLIGRDDVAAAYAVQQLLVAERIAAGRRVVGRKIGLTSAAVQAQLGVDQPDFGVLLDDMAYEDGDTIPAGSVLQPRVEAEVAFVLGSDLAEGPLGIDEVRAAVASATAALEICGSRVADWDISFGDTVADNASAGAFVLGRQRLPLTDVEPREVAMTMTVNDQEVATGTGEACLGDPLAALLWLARQARELGEPLRAGQVVLSGALGPMRAVHPGDRVTASFTGLGAVSVVIGEK